jgi:hypothetical protein
MRGKFDERIAFCLQGRLKEVWYEVLGAVSLCGLAGSEYHTAGSIETQISVSLERRWLAAPDPVDPVGQVVSYEDPYHILLK